MNFLLHTKHTMSAPFGVMRRYYSNGRILYIDRNNYRNLGATYTNGINLNSLNLSWNSNLSNYKYFSARTIHFGSYRFAQEPSSKVEETVNSIKEEKEQKKEELEQKKEAKNLEVTQDVPKVVVVKRTMWQKVKAELVHYYHGFRLLGLDMKVSAKLIWRILQGKELSRREHRLLVKTTGDVFRLIPFSVFIIVPFMEFLLPFFIKFFPGMLPSTFQTATDKEDKMKQSLKVKIEMAKFLQKTLDEMAVQSSGTVSTKAKEFSDFFYKVRTTGALATTDEILKFSKVFEDEITLDSLSRQQLIALCRVLDVQTLGTTNFLRFLIRMKLRNLAVDDKLIVKEGVETLTRAELQQACRARGMRAYGMPEHRLREQLMQWLDLSLEQKVPPSLLLLSRALMVPETIPMSDKLKATISALPDSVVARTKGAIGEKEGKMDHRTNIEIIKLEEQTIEEERKEQQEIESKEKERERKIPVEEAIIKAARAAEQKEEVEVTSKDVKVLEQALDNIGKEKKKMSVEKEEIKELKEEMAEYQEDIQELLQMKAESKGEVEIEDIKVSKGAKRLYSKINKMIGKLDKVLVELEQSEKKAKQDLEAMSPEEKPDSKAAAELVRIDELTEAIRKIQNVTDGHRLARIAEILGKIDDDKDGSLKIEEVMKVIEFIGNEEVKLSKKQVDEILDLMDKEEHLELEDQIQKALEKDQKEAKLKEDSIKVTSKSTVPATPVTQPDKQLEKEELEDEFTASPKVLKSSETTTPPVAPRIPPSPKKAEGSKQL